ncbi:Ku protein [Opitutus terrae]|uniref:Non-homologous end joining protein Ku n=1 Tax=Opitutus terrae (strain DSM 11246 / JCM 15787 / PB90-1) TaxID=452637 RepID=KU_OPITP|nr:Ku protein [Opitutus terrae]B1ZWL2.1 RecName: Full=Non-homologous end joining protein Ku [Opitutus terrae PB90-1]ACB73336.1 Ku domainn containing protein [Opitutus terrae PB90-1]
MRSLWKGSISFGLVNIPVALYPATRSEELKFRLLRSSDLSPVNYKRVAQADGREVPWEQIVKGYEYEKGKFVVLKEDDFKRVDVEATQTVDIMDFVQLDEVNPMYFHKPYYLVPDKGGAPAYTLLHDVLTETKKAGIAKVVIRTRQHLAAVKAQGQALVLEIMHFAQELVDVGELDIPVAKGGAKRRELDMAKALVEQMTETWQPERYTDDYTSALMAMIKEKIESGGKTSGAAPKPRRATNVIDLAAVLQESLNQTGAGAKKKPAKTAKRGKSRKAA